MHQFHTAPGHRAGFELGTASSTPRQRPPAAGAELHRDAAPNVKAVRLLKLCVEVAPSVRRLVPASAASDAGLSAGATRSAAATAPAAPAQTLNQTTIQLRRTTAESDGAHRHLIQLYRTSRQANYEGRAGGSPMARPFFRPNTPSRAVHASSSSASADRRPAD